MLEKHAFICYLRFAGQLDEDVPYKDVTHTNQHCLVSQTDKKFEGTEQLSQFVHAKCLPQCVFYGRTSFYTVHFKLIATPFNLYFVAEFTGNGNGMLTKVHMSYVVHPAILACANAQRA